MEIFLKVTKSAIVSWKSSLARMLFANIVVIILSVLASGQIDDAELLLIEPQLDCTLGNNEFNLSCQPKMLVGEKPKLVRSFNCESTFPQTMDLTELAQKFGRSNITKEDISLGEGFYESGTVLFADLPNSRIEILWKNQIQHQAPREIRVSGNKSSWITDTGISLGTTLIQVEAVNRYPFRLAGFGWDHSGNVISWGNGDLGKSHSKCTLSISLKPHAYNLSREYRKLSKQLQGGREFSSGHPAMQKLNPRTYHMLLNYE